MQTSAADFEPYSRDVYAWAYRLLGRHHDALDVVQDVFLRWNEQCHSQPPTHARGWLRRVTVNRAIDVQRSRRDQHTVYDHGALSEPAVPKKSLDVLDQTMLRKDVSAALDDLTEMQQSVIVAKVYDGLTFSEIAAELNVSVSTAKTHYLRALRAVRDKLAPRWSQEMTI